MSELLYIHVPFCLKKCGYCDFYSDTATRGIPAYVSALCREIKIRSGLSKGRQHARTIYFGGGTPSLLSLNNLETVLNTLHRWYRVVAFPEITLEANPGTLDKAYLRGLRKLGVNRLSLGIQSFRPEKLSTLGRIHTEKQAASALENARSAGFTNIGLDLIFGLPGESRASWRKDLARALAFSPEHLSCYMLTLEPGTPMFRQYEAGEFHPMSLDRQVDLFELTSEYLGDAGYDHYEISNYARSGSLRSRHNSGYWEMAAYEGFGPSAHSLCLGNGRQELPGRAWNVADLQEYIERLAVGELPAAGRESLCLRQQILEMVMIRLRTSEGIDVRAFNRLSDIPFNRWCGDLVDTLGREGLGRISAGGTHFSLTRAGWARLDSIVEAFADVLRSG